jgi:hypothetical protein
MPGARAKKWPRAHPAPRTKATIVPWRHTAWSGARTRRPRSGLGLIGRHALRSQKCLGGTRPGPMREIEGQEVALGSSAAMHQGHKSALEASGLVWCGSSKAKKWPPPHPASRAKATKVPRRNAGRTKAHSGPPAPQKKTVRDACQSSVPDGFFTMRSD